jgi:aminopeptidase C
VDGYLNFAEGGSFEDVSHSFEDYGVVLEKDMPNLLPGEKRINFRELTAISNGLAEGAKKAGGKVSPRYMETYKNVLETYLGKCPENFTYEGKQYTPKSFMASLGIDLNDYVSITSYTHHPFYTAFAVEVQDNWRFPLSYNVPMDEMMQIIDNAIENGYTVAWGGDVSEDGFTRKGLAYAIDTKQAQSLAGSDMAKWLKLDKQKKTNIIDSLGCTVPEIVPTQQMRQERFDNWELTDDHGMHIFGVAKDQNGKEYYMVKNSWGETGDYKGIWYMTKAFIAANTMDFLVNKKAIPANIRKKLGL